MSTDNQKPLRRCEHCGQIVPGNCDMCPNCGEQFIPIVPTSETVNDESSDSAINDAETTDAVNNEESENEVQENGNLDSINEVQSSDSINENESTDEVNDEHNNEDETDQDYSDSNYEYSTETNAQEHQTFYQRKKKIIIIVGIVVAVLIVGFIGISFYFSTHRLNKPITEALSESDLKSLCDDDPTFMAFYKQVNIIRASIVTEADKEKFGEITYQEMKDFLQMYTNDSYCARLLDVAKKQYDSQCRQPILPQLNALVAKWKKFEEDHNPNSYIKIDAHTAITMNLGFSRPTVWFSLKFPKGSIKDCSVYACCKSKDDEYEICTGSERDYSLFNLKDSSAESAWIVADSFASDFWSYWSYYFEVKSVTLPDETIVTLSDTIQVPDVVRNYLNNSTPENEYEMVKAQINPSYPTFDQYASKVICDKLKEKDSLCFELVEMTNAPGDFIHRGWKYFAPVSE